LSRFDTRAFGKTTEVYNKHMYCTQNERYRIKISSGKTVLLIHTGRHCALKENLNH